VRAFDLNRFRRAQDAPNGGFDTALFELRAGRKQSHWIWYVFPQLAGLGQSSTALYYGLEGAEEAAAYVRDDVLGDRLVRAAAAVRGHVTGAQSLRLDTLMGSQIDALKVVSCMTLFEHLAKRPGAVDSCPRFASIADHAEAILTAAARQGYRRCAFTEQHLEI
jgi:uncharacterized protein (DUF1810 family)